MQGVLCAELIGRGDELEVAHAAVADAVAGRGGLLFVSGEAGVGKSRLVRELVALAREQSVHVLQGRAVPAEAPTPFRAIAGALLSYFRHSGLPDVPALAAYRPALGLLLPEWRVPGAGVAEPMILAEAVVRLLRTVAGSTACLVVLEDLHWADPETLELLEYFADALSTEPVLVVGTVREEQGRARHLVDALGAARAATVVELGPLPDEEVGRMAARCLGAGAVDAHALASLQDWSDGLPFLVEELLATGVLAQVDGTWVLAESAGPHVPVTFGDGVRARLRRLGESGERVLGAAALLGRRFDWSLIPAATGLPDEEVNRALRAAVECQLLVVTPVIGFGFRHSLTRDAVLGELMPGERAVLAGALLDCLPDGADPELAVTLAGTAGRHEQEAELLLGLGRRSLESGALDSAEQMLSRARRTGTSDRLLADVDEALLAVLALAGKTDAALTVGVRLAAGLSRLDAPVERLARTHLEVARAAVTACRWEVARTHLDLAQAWAGTPELAARVQGLTATAALGRGDPANALQGAERALELATAHGLHELACEALEVIGRCRRLEDAEASARAFERGLEVAEEHDLVLWQARALAELATLDQLACADDSRMLAARERALACGAWSLAAHVDLGTGHWALNHFDTALAQALLTRAEETARSLGMDALGAMAAVSRGLAHAMDGDAAALETALSQADAGADPAVLGMAWSSRGIQALLTEHREQAVAAFERARVLFSTLPTAPPVPSRAVHGLLAVQEGAPVGEARALGDVHAIARGFFALADAVAAGRSGSHAEAVSAFQRADDALTRADGWRHLGYRLVAENALRDGWGEPGRWLREALAWFEERRLSRAADATRALLRTAGVPVPRRTGAALELPQQLRAAGVTAREAQILALLAEGLTNQAIAERVFLSARTIERHLANVAAKVGTGSRSELVAYAARTSPG